MQEEPVEAVLLGRISLFVRLLNFPFYHLEPLSSVSCGRTTSRPRAFEIADLAC